MTGMTKDRVRELLAAYGADAERWPEAEREPARRLAASDPGLASEIAEAAALDALLDAMPVPAPSPALRVRLKAIPDRAPARWAERLSALWPFGAPWRPAAGLVAAALVGVLVGFTAPQPPQPDGEWIEADIAGPTYDAVSAVAAMASGAGDLEMLQ